LPDFFANTYQSAGEIYQIINKYTKWPYTYVCIILNVRETGLIDIKYICILTASITTPSKIYPNLDFWFENTPSGNPDPFREKAMTAGQPETSDETPKRFFSSFGCNCGLETI
jgi:hypothetical protein